MSQQITITIVVDSQAAIKTGTLAGNIFLIDDLNSDGSEGKGTDHLITAIKGNSWCDGSQASDIVLNWLILGIDSLPPTLPRDYIRQRSKKIQKEALNSLLESRLNANSDPQKTKNEYLNQIEQAMTPERIADTDGNIKELDFKTLNAFGQPFQQGDHSSTLRYFSPSVTMITGEAVKNNVLFPAQYGTPMTGFEGWYWSATVDTCKTGIHQYTLHIKVFNRVEDVWVPVIMTIDAWIKVTNEPMYNGFTHAGIGYLPII